MTRKKKTIKKSPVKSKSNFGMVIERLDRIESLLTKEKKEEDVLVQDETAEISELQKLEQLEEAVKKEVSPHPLTRMTYHDLTKGLIGAFVGVVGHFAFFYGHDLAEGLSNARAWSLLGVSLLLLVSFLYFSGFRRIKEYNKYLPIRVIVIYTTAIVVSVSVLFLFNVLAFPIDWHEVFLNTAAVSVLAVMGAATADLIGGE